MNYKEDSGGNKIGSAEPIDEIVQFYGKSFAL